MQRSVLAAILLCAVPLIAQHQERITVNVVEVPVRVSRFDGSPVRNLKAEDFELIVNGEPQRIEYFDVLADDRAADRAAAPAAVDPQRELQRRRLYLLLFDLTNLSQDYMKKARESALQFVAEAPAGDTFAVATLRLTGIHFAVPFTNDRIAVERAIVTLSASQAGDVFRLATTSKERAMFAAADASARIPSPGEWQNVRLNDPPTIALSESRAVAVAAGAEKQAREIQQEHVDRVRERALENLVLLGDALAPISGLKHVVVLSEPSPTTGSIFDTVSGRVRIPRGEVAFLPVVARLQERYQRAGVTFNVLDVPGPYVPWTAPGGKFASDTGGLRRDPQRLMQDLSRGTGGTVAHNLKKIREHHGHTYVLGFRPTAAGQRKENEIRVKVKNQSLGTYVRHRQSYSLDPARSASGESLFLADVLLNDIDQNGVTVNLDVRNGALVAAIPGKEILGYGRDGATMLDVFLYVFDEKQLVAWWKHVRLRVDLEAGREFLEANPYAIRQPVDLAPGRYSAKALVRVVGSDATGFKRTDFHVPQG